MITQEQINAATRAIWDSDEPLELRDGPTHSVNASVLKRVLEAADAAAWQPIDDAPDDGRCLLQLETDDGFEMRVLDRNSDGDWIYDGEPTYCASYYINPTHFRPLPEPAK